MVVNSEGQTQIFPFSVMHWANVRFVKHLVSETASQYTLIGCLSLADVQLSTYSQLSHTAGNTKNDNQ